MKWYGWLGAGLICGILLSIFPPLAIAFALLVYALDDEKE